jgi:hypothetical protein
MRGLDILTEILKFGEVPSPSGITPSHQVKDGAQSERESIRCLRHK